MVRRGFPRTLQQFHRPEFLQDDAAPIRWRAYGRQAALAFATVLIAEHATLAGLIAAQSMRTQQPRTFLLNRLHGLSVGYRRPNQPVDVFHRLNLRFNDTHFTFTIPLETLSSINPIFYNTVVLDGWSRPLKNVCPVII